MTIGAREYKIVLRTYCKNRWRECRMEEFNQEIMTFEDLLYPCDFEYCSRFEPTEEAVDRARCGTCGRKRSVERRRENCKNFSRGEVKWCNGCGRVVK